MDPMAVGYSTGITLETGNRGPQGLAHPVWTKPIIPRVLSHGWVLLGVVFSSEEHR